MWQTWSGGFGEDEWIVDLMVRGVPPPTSGLLPGQGCSLSDWGDEREDLWLKTEE